MDLIHFKSIWWPTQPRTQVIPILCYCEFTVFCCYELPLHITCALDNNSLFIIINHIHLFICPLSTVNQECQWQKMVRIGKLIIWWAFTIMTNYTLHPTGLSKMMEADKRNKQTETPCIIFKQHKYEMLLGNKRLYENNLKPGCSHDQL